jgi:hypothetical protein
MKIVFGCENGTKREVIKISEVNLMARLDVL